MTVVHPQSGWYGEREPYRLTDVSGELTADADTHEIKSANVSWDSTAPAGTYAEYALVRMTTESPTTYRITVEVDSKDTDLNRPTWVGDADANKIGGLYPRTRPYPPSRWSSRSRTLQKNHKTLLWASCSLSAVGDQRLLVPLLCKPRTRRALIVELLNSLGVGCQLPLHRYNFQGPSS